MSLVQGPDNSLRSSPRLVMAPTEDLSSALRRMAKEQVEVMLCGFAKEDDDAVLDNNVHLARKAGKRLRALLRLCRSELGDDLYRSTNALVRDQGRRLSHARTSQVLVKTLDMLVEESAIADEDANLLRPILEQRHADALAQLRTDVDGREQAHEALTGLEECIDVFPAPVAYGALDVEALQPALERSYRSARKPMQSAHDLDSAHGFHEWRKRVNHLRYQLEALSGACAPPVGAMAETLDELSEVLGADHDLADLGECVIAHPDRMPERLVALLVARSSSLRERSFEIAEAVVAEKPKDFVRFFAAQSRPRR